MALILAACGLLIGGALLWNHLAQPGPVPGSQPGATSLQIEQPLGFATIGNPVRVVGAAANTNLVDVTVVDNNGGVLATTTLEVSRGRFDGQVWYRATETPVGRVRVRGPGGTTSAVVTFPSERASVAVSFVPKNADDPCAASVAVTRTVVGSATWGAIEELLRGPFDAERERMMSMVPVGTRLVEIEETERTVRLVFSPELDRNIGGSCLVGAIRRQIQTTAAAASGGKGVIIAVQGKPDDEVLQP